MTIVLPHGVLFRGGEEGAIRKNLIESNHIDTIIGLPPNIFFGTGIPTIVLVLKQKRANTDVLIVDASKGFAKVGKNNKLRASDIKKVCDTVIGREDCPHYANLVSREEIRANDYNLNIPRYVDSSEAAESWDIYASMFGGIPNSELDELADFWMAFPTLRYALFTKSETPYVEPKVTDLAQAMSEHIEIKSFKTQFAEAFADFNGWLNTVLIEQMQTLNIAKQESRLGEAIFARLAPIPLIDKYQAYQLLDDHWLQIAIDLEILQTESFDATRVVEPNMVMKTKNGKKEEVQEGWKGRIMPFDLVQTTHLQKELQRIQQEEQRLSEIGGEFEEIIGSLSEADGEYGVLNNSNDKFAATETKNELKEALSAVESEEIGALYGYLDLLDAKVKKPEKEAYIAKCTKVEWDKMEANKDGTYGKAKVNKYIGELQQSFTFPEDSFASKLIKASKLLAEEKQLNAAIKTEAAALHLQTKATIEGLNDKQVYDLIERKWIHPLSDALHQLPNTLMAELTAQLEALAEKYRVTYADNAREIKQTESSLANLIDELDGNPFDMQGLAEFKTFLKGE